MHRLPTSSRSAVEHRTDARLNCGKTWYLNTTFFYFRVGLYFLVWIVVSRRLFRWSVKQDDTKDPKLTVAAQRFSPVAAILCALTLTFAGFDWVMSLYPYWYSTIFGVWFFAGGFVATYALITLVTLSRSAHRVHREGASRSSTTTTSES